VAVPGEGVDLLVKFLQDSSRYNYPELVEVALQALGEIGDPKGAQVLVKEALVTPGWANVSDKEKQQFERSHQYAVQGLARMGEAALEPIAEHLKNPRVGPECLPLIEAAGRIGGPAAARALMGLIEHASAGIQKKAAVALGNIGEEGFQQLGLVLKDKDGLRRYYAAQAFRRMVEGWDESNYDAAAPGQKAGDRVAELLLAALADEDYRVREEATAALAGLKCPSGVEPLMAILSNPREEPTVRRNAATALGKLRDGRALEVLLAGAEDRAMNVRLECAKALGRLGDERAIAVLARAALDPVPEVARAAKEAIASIRGVSSEAKRRSPWH
jgi:HEAT repeat protein